MNSWITKIWFFLRIFLIRIKTDINKKEYVNLVQLYLRTK